MPSRKNEADADTVKRALFKKQPTASPAAKGSQPKTPSPAQQTTAARTIQKFWKTSGRRRVKNGNDKIFNVLGGMGNADEALSTLMQKGLGSADDGLGCKIPKDREGAAAAAEIDEGRPSSPRASGSK